MPPNVSAAQLETEAQMLFSQKRRVARISSQIVSLMFSPPVAPPVFSGSAGNLLAELTIFLTTTGMECLLLPQGKRMQFFVDRASTLLPLEDIDVTASQLKDLGARMTHGGTLLESETSSSFPASVVEAERCCSQRAEAFVQASSAPNSTMCTMLKKAKLIQQGQPGIGPFCALAVALEPYQAESKMTKDDYLDLQAEILSCTFDRSMTLRANLRNFRAQVAALGVAMKECGMPSSLSDPQAEWSALLNAARQSALGPLLKQMLTIAKLSGSVNFATLLCMADDVAHDEDKNAAKAAAARAAELAATPKRNDVKDTVAEKLATETKIVVADVKAAAKNKAAAAKAQLQANAARSVLCFNCGAREHVSSLCPKPTPPVGQKMCWTCGIVGHVAAACPSKSSGAEPPKNP